MEGNLSRLEGFACKGIDPAHCRTCAFSNGEAPFEDAPEKRYCIIYSRASGKRKPDGVYYRGEECEFHVDRA